MDVLLLEKERLPRYKTCAGGIPLKTVQLLDLALASAYQTPITRGRCTYRGGSPVSTDFGKVVGWTVKPDEFDHLILAGAMKPGARVIDGQRVREVETHRDRAYVRSSEQVYSCSVVVRADGANGVVARSAGLITQRRLGVAVESVVQVQERVLESRPGCVHFDFGHIPWAYGWVFPKKRHLSVGVGAFRGKSAHLKARLFGLLRRLGLPADPEKVGVRGHFVPLGGVNRILHRERILLTGDAASLAEPVTGEGIYYAIKSAKLASKVICQALEASSFDLSPYTEQINASVTRDLKYAHCLGTLVYRLPRLSYHFFVRNATIRWEIADVLYGDSTFEQLFRKLIRNSPGILLRGLAQSTVRTDAPDETRRRL